MPSKELIEKVAEAIADADGEGLEFYPAYYNALAKSAISTILAALQEPTEGMLDALFTENGCSEDFKKYVTNRIRHDWRAMLATSALGEQSE